MEIETIKKTKREVTMDVDKLGNGSGGIDASMTTKIEEVEERISGIVVTIENIHTSVKYNSVNSA